MLQCCTMQVINQIELQKSVINVFLLHIIIQVIDQIELQKSAINVFLLHIIMQVIDQIAKCKNPDQFPSVHFELSLQFKGEKGNISHPCILLS